jgi:uncharacterized protein (DUF488 family)
LVTRTSIGTAGFTTKEIARQGFEGFRKNEAIRLQVHAAQWIRIIFSGCERRRHMRIYTVGFTRKSAEQFFEMLRSAGARRLVDVRLNNVSQLAGFAKKQDLAYFLDRICGMEYVHEPLLAPTQEMLDEYRKGKGNWGLYSARFLDLMKDRAIEQAVARELLDSACLLCSEEKPDRCHRRLVAEYLAAHWTGVEICHLG